jgi:hypothetical protein
MATEADPNYFVSCCCVVSHTKIRSSSVFPLASIAHSLPLTHTHTLSLSLCRTLSLFLYLSLSLSLSFSLTYTLLHIRKRTHTANRLVCETAACNARTTNATVYCTTIPTLLIPLIFFLSFHFIPQLLGSFFFRSFFLSKRLSLQCVEPLSCRRNPEEAAFFLTCTCGTENGKKREREIGSTMGSESQCLPEYFEGRKCDWEKVLPHEIMVECKLTNFHSLPQTYLIFPVKQPLLCFQNL